ncbi:DUF4407 domain-containing protein [Actinoplanes sp. NPDC051861]|uniref:DUF4407 domain-containing protein n=1 Tax=Actinoplanes sp. NPDC051861 TaxID=3155170 RepID=UPI00342BD988
MSEREPISGEFVEAVRLLGGSPALVARLEARGTTEPDAMVWHNEDPPGPSNDAGRPADTPRSDRESVLSRVLWWLAGADATVLRQSPRSEKLRYRTLGAAIFLTSVMGGIATFEAAGAAGIQNVMRGLIAVAFAALIVGFERLQVINVSSTLSPLSRILRTVPAIVFGTILALLVATPLVLRVFTTEINAEIAANQLSQRIEYQQKQQAEPALVEATENFDESNVILAQAQRDLAAEITGVGPTGAAGYGPRAALLHRQTEAAQTRLDAASAQLEQVHTRQAADLAAFEAGNRDISLFTRLSALSALGERYRSVGAVHLTLLLLLASVWLMPSLLIASFPFRRPTVYESLLQIDQRFLVARARLVNSEESAPRTDVLADVRAIIDDEYMRVRRESVEDVRRFFEARQGASGG